jgi:hypothetical protein
MSRLLVAVASSQPLTVSRVMDTLAVSDER